MADLAAAWGFWLDEVRMRGAVWFVVELESDGAAVESAAGRELVAGGVR
ncbi:hypothetical protein ACFWYW_53525 [Nonomuraea sp. NPDC059023]